MTRNQENQTAGPERKDALRLLLATLLFSLGVMLLPARKFGGLFLHDEENALLLGSALFRTVGFIVAVIAARRMRLRLFSSCTPVSLLLSLPFTVVVAGNYPVGALIGGAVTLSAGALRVACLFYYCIAVGAFEEIVFRGIALPLFTLFFKGRFRLFFAAAADSALFALCHLVNLLSGNAGAVFMQVGYSFLVGGMCALVYLLCPNILLCGALHALFDLGGFMATYLGAGMVWVLADILLTVFTAVAGTAYALWLYLTRLQNTQTAFWIKNTINGEGEPQEGDFRA